MENIKVGASFKPEKLKAYTKNEGLMLLTFDNSDSSHSYWCECKVDVKSPLSLAHDVELTEGITRVGIIKPKSKLEKQVRFYTRPNNFPDNYDLKVTLFAYDEEGTIAERLESKHTIQCVP